MPVIYVRAKAGRKVTDIPGGKVISSDEFVPVRETGRIRRYIEIHGDLEEQGGSPNKAAKSSAPKGEEAAQAARTAAVQEAAAQEAARVAAQEAAAKPAAKTTDKK